MEKQLQALIDGDIIVYSCGFSAEQRVYSVLYEDEDGTPIEEDVKDGNEARRRAKELSGQVAKVVIVEPVENAIGNANSLINRIRKDTMADSYRMFLTGKGNFREELYPEYKANRPDVKPTHYDALKSYLIRVHGAEVVDGMEADDAMSIHQTDSTIICTIDKDLDMVPGLHYNWNSERVYTIDETTGLRNFYKQVIKGDTTDNIPGLFKLTGKRATRDLFDHIDTLDKAEDMWEYILSLYKGVDEETILINARLLYMRRKEDEFWSPPSAEEKSGEEEYGQVQPSKNTEQQNDIQPEEGEGK